MINSLVIKQHLNIVEPHIDETLRFAICRHTDLWSSKRVMNSSAMRHGEGMKNCCCTDIEGGIHGEACQAIDSTQSHRRVEAIPWRTFPPIRLLTRAQIRLHNGPGKGIYLDHFEII